MNTRKILLTVSVISWAIMAGLVLRSNVLIGSLTFGWPNVHHPNAVFRWATPPGDGPVTLPPNTTRTFKITVPRAFTSGTLQVNFATTKGELTAVIGAPLGQADTTGTSTDGQTVVLPLQWTSIAVRTRTFSVTLASHDQPVVIRGMTMTISRS